MALFSKIWSTKTKCYYEKRYECYEKTGHDLQKFDLQNCFWVNESQKQVLQKFFSFFNR